LYNCSWQFGLESVKNSWIIQFEFSVRICICISNTWVHSNKIFLFLFDKLHFIWMSLIDNILINSIAYFISMKLNSKYSDSINYRFHFIHSIFQIFNFIEIFCFIQLLNLFLWNEFIPTFWFLYFWVQLKNFNKLEVLSSSKYYDLFNCPFYFKESNSFKYFDVFM